LKRLAKFTPPRRGVCPKQSGVCLKQIAYRDKNLKDGFARRRFLTFISCLLCSVALG
jgi:hypothetical protein